LNNVNKSIISPLIGIKWNNGRKWAQKLGREFFRNPLNAKRRAIKPKEELKNYFKKTSKLGISLKGKPWDRKNNIEGY